MDLQTSQGMMTPDERRTAPRFPMRLPMRVKFFNERPHEESTFTRDVSSSGVFFYLDGYIQNHPGEQEAIEFTLTLPLTSALAQEIRVRYTGQVVRVENLADGKLGVAVRTSGHEFVPTGA
jgi:PilZ domain-containing protein